MQSAPLILNADASTARRNRRGRSLSQAGFEVVEAGSGIEAVRIALAHKPNVVLLSLVLPDLDGLEVCRRIRSAWPAAAIVHLADDAGPEQQLASLEGAGADCCLSDDIDPRVLAAQIRRLIHGRSKNISDIQTNFTDHIPHPVWVAGIDGVLEYANRRALAFAGLSPGQNLEVEGRAHVHPDDWPMVLERLTAAVRTGHDCEVLCRLRPASAESYRWHVVHATPVRSDSGAVERWCGTCTDIHEYEQSFRVLWDGGMIGLAASDGETIQEANDSFLKVTGFTRDDVLAGAIRSSEVTAPEYRDAELHALGRVLETGWCDPFEMDLLRKDGRRAPVLVRVALLEREPLRFLWLVVDFRRARESEKQASDPVGVLAAGVAHEFNNLLTGVLGNTTLVRDTLPASRHERDLLDDAIQAAQTAADLTRQMLAYAGKGRFVVRPVKLTTLIHDRLAFLRAVCPSHVELTLELDDVPAVEADPGQMQQILGNLVMNAAEAIGERPGSICLRTGSTFLDAETVRRDFAPEQVGPGLYVCLEVSDSGCGMDDTIKPRIFEPFFSTKFQGRGMGLAAVAGIVRAHGGAILVQSAPDAGSVFRVFLPALAR